MVMEILMGLVGMLKINFESQMPLEDMQELESDIKLKLEGLI